MKKDHWDMDGQMLRLLLSVMEKGSFTTARSLLELTQWAVREIIQTATITPI
jgi:DNA-binding transcriptional LysR family regulator